MSDPSHRTWVVDSIFQEALAVPHVHVIVSPSTRSLKVCLSVMKRHASSAVVSSVKKKPSVCSYNKIRCLASTCHCCEAWTSFLLCLPSPAWLPPPPRRTYEGRVVVDQGFLSGGRQPLENALQPEYEGILVGEHRVLWQTRRHIFRRIQTLEVQ